MTQLEPSDPFARLSQTFPVLTDEQIVRMIPFGSIEQIESGSRLFEQGERLIDFFLVLEGTVDIIEMRDGAETLFTATGPGQFTGELYIVSDRAALSTARASEDSCVLRIGRSCFRRMISAEPDIGEIAMRAFILRRMGLLQRGASVTVVGSPRDPNLLRIRTFLMRNSHPHTLAVAQSDSPSVVLSSGLTLQNPSTPELADALGLSELPETDRLYDVAVVGAGPAGLAASVYAASEGLDTIIIEAMAPGGQAGTSSRIENYLGFPTGISGNALAGRAQIQAQKFGARLSLARQAKGMECAAAHCRIRLCDGRQVAARTVVVATGARYRRLHVPGYDQFEGRGIMYAATAMEAQFCAGQDVVVVGGGNSAGQAAVFLSRTARHVHILVRKDSLKSTMSDYLVQRIEQSAHISLHPSSEITALAGDSYLRRVTWADRRQGDEMSVATNCLFVMIGAEPNTGWLEGWLELDENGFVVTGAPRDGAPSPSPFSTTRPGVFAVGDVRSGSVKRVASSVGEGSVAISAVHDYLSALASG